MYAALLVACSFPRSGSSQPDEPDPKIAAPVGPIKRNLDELERVKYSRMACEGNQDCPVGSHCDDDTSACQWQCLADSDCGPGKSCDALGMCGRHPIFYKSDALDECLAQDPATRRLALLGDGTDDFRPLDDQHVTCVLGTDNDNDDCPCGSYCNIAAECHVDCITDNPPPGYEVGAGERCTPSGRRVPSSASGDGPPLQVTLSITPPKLTANTAVAASQLMAVTVNVDVNSLDFLQANHPAIVRYSVLPLPNLDGTAPSGPNAQVNCTPTHTGALAASCDLSGGWVFDVAGQNLHSQPRTIWVQVPQTATPRRWMLVARSQSAEAPATSTVEAAPVVVPGTDPGGYTGTVAWSNAGASAALSVPIQAIVTTTHIALLEPTRVLLPDGHAVLSRDASKSTMLGWLGATIAGASTRYDVRLDLGTLSYDTTTGHLAGGITLTNGTGTAAAALALTLDRLSDVTGPACTSGGCAAGSYCEAAMNVCLPGAGAAAGAGIVMRSSGVALPSKTLSSAQLASWAPAVATLVAGNPTLLGGAELLGMQHAYCYQNNESIPASFGINGGLRDPSQDFGCMLGSLPGTPETDQRTFAFENRKVEVELDASHTQTFNLLDACLGDLAVAPPPNATRANTLDVPRPCASLAQFFLALNANTSAGIGHTLAAAPLRMATQLLRQWLGVNAYIANTGVQDRQFDDALGNSTAPADTRLGSVIDVVEQGLRVLLDPAVRPQFADGAAEPVIAVAPDYRIMDRPVSRWTFNNVTGGVAPGVDGVPAFNTGLADTSSTGILTPAGATTCQSTQPIFINNDTFSIAFYLANPIFGGTVKLFEKVASDGKRLWVEATPGASNQLNLALKDSSGGSALFPTVSSVGGVWGLLGFVADNGSYRLYVAQPGATQVGVFAASFVAAGGARWATQGPVQLACSVPRACDRGACTSWDRNVPGDGLDVTFSSSNADAWSHAKVCTTDTRAHRTTCTGSLGSQAECTASASARRTQLIAGLFPNPPASALSQLTVTGTMVETVDRDDLDDGFQLTTTDTCHLAISNLPAPVTSTKPVCDCAAGTPVYAPQGVFYDELSLWNRALDPTEFAGMAGSYNFTSANETVRSATTLAGEQAIGLAAHLVEAAAADLNLLASYLNAARGASYGECYLGGGSPSRDLARNRAGRNLRLVSVIEGEAAHLASAPGTSSAPWYPRYQADLTVLGANRAKVMQELQLLSDCRNPLGIPEEELPLFVGQAVGAADRFFASTHFLVGLANAEITAATTALTSAQNAYNAQVTADFTRHLSSVDQQQNIEKLKVSYDGVLRRYCGAPSGTRLVDGFMAGTLDASNCFIKTERSECQAETTKPLINVQPSCLRGELGERFTAMQSAYIDMSTAKKAVDRTLAQYAADMEYCGRRQEYLHETEKILDLHLRHMQSLRATQSFHNDLVGLADGIVHADFRQLANSINTVTRNLGIEIGFHSNELAQQKEIEDNDAVMQARSHELDIEECYHKVDNEWFAIGASFDVMTHGMQALVAATSGVQDAETTLSALAVEAAGQLALETAVDRTPPHLHYWLGSAIDAYNRHMKGARRLTYLAVRAYEYEAQLSSTLRGGVLTARQPNDLTTVTTILGSQTAPVSGGSFHIGQEGVVLSLRDEILHIEDLANNIPGQPRPSPTAVFQRYLTSDAARVYGQDGRLVGRSVRFTIEPAFWNQLLCAERLVRVTPLVSFDGPRPAHSDLLLIQDNAFASQACGAPPGDVDLTRVGAATNLVTDDTSANFQPPASSSSMIINLVPATVVSRQDLEGLPFGDSSDFTGRGLYGKYTLMFPEAPPCTGTPPTVCPGWSENKLAQVKDVLLRFDIVEATQQVP